MTKHEIITAEVVTHKGLYAALAAAQAEMGKALKDTSNPHFKSKYADLSSVCAAHPETNAREVRRWLDEAGVV